MASRTKAATNGNSASAQPRPRTTKGRGRRERNAEETKARILEAATGEFARKGYDGARLRDVAETAGVHHALLHHYYGDKEGLFRAVVERAFESASSRAFEALRSTRDVYELAERYVDTIVDFYADNPSLVQILHFAYLDEGSPAYAQCEEIGQRISMPLLEETAKQLRRAQKRGVVRDDIAAERLVVLGMGTAAYVFHEAKFFAAFMGQDVREPEALAAHKKAVLALLVDGVFRPAR
ncbi:MAG: TetR/AcrR family transcriptional regulator [Myxococcota bacterium]